MRVVYRQTAAIVVAGVLSFLVLGGMASDVWAQGPAADPTIGSGITGQLMAAEAGSGGGGIRSPPEAIVARIINYTFVVVGIVMLAFMVYAGYLWMTAGGEEAKVERAQMIIKNSTIGLIIVILSYAASRFIISRLVVATAPN